MSNRKAPVDHPILPLMQDRWSPRALTNTVIPANKVLTLLEAARWTGMTRLPIRPGCSICRRA